MAQRPAWHWQSVSTFLWLRSPVGQIITGSLMRRGCSVCLWLCSPRQGTTCGALRTRPQTHAFSLPLASHGLSSGSSPRRSSSRLHLPSPLSHPPCRRLENTSTTHGSERQWLTLLLFQHNWQSFCCKKEVKFFLIFVCYLTLNHEYFMHI